MVVSGCGLIAPTGVDGKKDREREREREKEREVVSQSELTMAVSPRATWLGYLLIIIIIRNYCAGSRQKSTARPSGKQKGYFVGRRLGRDQLWRLVLAITKQVNFFSSSLALFINELSSNPLNWEDIQMTATDN